MTIKTTEYEWTSGKKPSGFGNWIFILSGNGKESFFEVTANYSEAKKQAISFAKENGFTEIEVGA